jgi:hypothetical protein
MLFDCELVEKSLQCFVSAMAMGAEAKGTIFLLDASIVACFRGVLIVMIIFQHKSIA